MSEEWRIRIALEQPPGPALWQELTDAPSVPKKGIPFVGGRPLYEDTVFFRYAETEQDVGALQQRVLQQLAGRGVTGQVTVERLHSDMLRWEDPSVPMPTAEELEQAELERAAQAERANQPPGVAAQFIDGILNNL